VTTSRYRPAADLSDTPYGRLREAGAPIVALYVHTVAGRIQEINAVLDPSERRAEQMGGPCYFTERSPHHAYAIGQWIGHFTPGEAVAQAIGYQTERVDAARKKLARLEAQLARYHAAAEALTR
jgi:hypothetical protein